MKSIQSWPAPGYLYPIVRIMTRSRQAQGQGLHSSSCKSLILESFQTGTNDLIDALIRPNVGLSVDQHPNVLPLPPPTPPQKLIFIFIIYNIKIPWLSWSFTQCLSGSLIRISSNGWSKKIRGSVLWHLLTKQRCVACVKPFKMAWH